MARGKDKGYRVRAIVVIRVAAELISVILKFGPPCMHDCTHVNARVVTREVWSSMQH